MKQILLLAATAALLTAPALAAGGKEGEPDLLSFSGQPVARIAYECPVPFPEGEFNSLVALRAGDTFLPARLREGVAGLYRTSLFEQVGVRIRKEGEGLAVLFFLQPRRILGKVLFQGNLQLPDGDLVKKVLLRRGERINDRALEETRKQILAYYAYRGFSETELTYSTEYTARAPEIDVFFRIKEGTRPFLGDVLLRGDSGLSRFRLLSFLGSRLGEGYDGEHLDADLEELRGYFRRQGYYSAEIESNVDRSKAAHGVVVTISIHKGVRTVFAAETDRRGDEARMTGLAREVFLSETDPARAASSVLARVRGNLLGDGYPFASVAWKESTTDGERTLLLSVREGKRTLLGKVTVEGADSLSEKEVASTLLLDTGKPFVRTRVEEALSRLEKLYHSRGYLAAKTSLQPLLFTTRGEEQEVQITIHVMEGVRTLVGGFDILGAESLAGDLGTTVSLAKGGPYVPEEMDRGRERILERLGRDGFLYAAVTVGETFSPDRKSVRLSVQVTPGPRVTLGNVVVFGTRYVDGGIIRRALDIRRGDILTMDKILQAQKRLYQLDVLDSVEVKLAEQPSPGPVKDIVVDVRERNRFLVGLRLGYSNEQRGNGEVSFTHRNVGGLARSLKFTARAGNRGRLGSVTYTIPWFLDQPMDFSLSLTDQVEEKESYSRDDATVSAGLKRQVSDRTVVNLTYSFGGVRLFDVAPGAVLSPEDQGHTNVAFLGPEIVFDGRDDQFEPGGGILTDLKGEAAWKGIGSQSEYYKLEASLRYYQSLGSGYVLAMMARAGLVKSFGDTPEVLISKRYFLGGQNSVRGYAPDSLGPLDALGKPLGGNYLVNVNAEMRYPIWKALRGVAFVDSGSLWLAISPYNQFSLRFSAGAGLRWSTPIGPFSLDYGYKLNPATTTEERWYVHFSIGHAF